MTPEETFLNLLELSLIEKHGNEYTDLSEEDKCNLLHKAILDYFDNLHK